MQDSFARENPITQRRIDDRVGVTVNWAQLLQELLQLVAQQLAIEDFMAFHGVCTSWRSATTVEKHDVRKKAPLAYDS
ncbi:hypothetical protein NL676_014550 [Syzygium grande]|nr:hypothetical protein NL676_036577 [Syzygium grande]KAI6700226.1 hypothetical protein NL676_014550 [Syzygium grande]